MVAVELNGDSVAYSYPILEAGRVVNDVVGGQDVVVFWLPGTTSALDGSQIAASEDVGSAAVFDPNLKGQKLTFAWDGENFVDEQSNSKWNIFGEAIEGEFAGQKLTPVLHANHFWFAWAAFAPETRVYGIQ